MAFGMLSGMIGGGGKEGGMGRYEMIMRELRRMRQNLMAEQAPTVDDTPGLSNSVGAPPSLQSVSEPKPSMLTGAAPEPSSISLLGGGKPKRRSGGLPGLNAL